jgi:uncharacterized membrane protein YdjX (TVP38/TMEM64 family)
MNEDWVTAGENLQNMLLAYGNLGLLIMTLLHTLHAVIAFIPAAIIQFVGGMIYGTTLGVLTCLIGIPIGTAIAFYLSRHLGKRVVTLFVSPKNIARLEKLFTGNTSVLVLLILFLLPTPKDFFAYFVGLTNMKAAKFFLISFVGRLPGILVSTYLGAHIFDKNYALIISVIVLTSAVSLLCYVFKDKIIEKLNQYSPHIHHLLPVPNPKNQRQDQQPPRQDP